MELKSIQNNPSFCASLKLKGGDNISVSLNDLEQTALHKITSKIGTKADKFVVSIGEENAVGGGLVETLVGVASRINKNLDVKVLPIHYDIHTSKEQNEAYSVFSTLKRFFATFDKKIIESPELKKFFDNFDKRIMKDNIEFRD